MSNINITGIVASVSQSLVQQKQVARAQDADRNRKQEAARKLQEQTDQRAQAIEDPTETSDQTMKVRSELQHHEQALLRRRDARQSGYPETPDADGHVDVEA